MSLNILLVQVLPEDSTGVLKKCKFCGRKKSKLFARIVFARCDRKILFITCNRGHT